MQVETTYSWGIWGVLLLLLILKLSGAVNMSWLWVLAPLWLPLSVLLCVLAIVMIVVCFGGLSAFVLTLLRKGDK